MYLLDTNIISEMRKIAKGKGNSNVAAWLERTDQTGLYTSAVVIMELERGVLGMERKDPIQGAALRAWKTAVTERFFKGRILPIDAATAEICARLHIPDRSPENDVWIAATAKQHGLILATRNVKDMEQTGVKLFDPFA
ncbi:MAG: type II toxin-antitoxin system VapC family toxin [Neisseria sp.]|nr:type II toxin-antitoxin system VapC family toxin [Neisseria sp.]